MLWFKNHRKPDVVTQAKYLDGKILAENQMEPRPTTEKNAHHIQRCEVNKPNQNLYLQKLFSHRSGI
jgi:hypothetical protein